MKKSELKQLIKEVISENDESLIDLKQNLILIKLRLDRLINMVDKNILEPEEISQISNDIETYDFPIWLKS